MNSFKAFFTYTLLHIALTATLDQIDYQTENRGINSLTNLLSQNATLSTSELERAVEKSYWNLAAKMIQEYYNPNHIDYSQNLVKCKKKLKRTQNAEFEKLTSLMPLDFPTIQKVAPAFLWGQNMTFLLVKIKFSARLDLPGSLEVQNLNITFDYDRFIFSALSFEQSDFAIHYYLEIETFHHLNTHFCQWKYDSVGTVYLEMMKSPAPYFWRNIFIDQHKKLPNQYMWWDVYLNYMEDFNSYGANALLLFDQRELERERKEEKEEFLEKMKKRDARLQRKRDAKIQTESIQALRNKMYCWFTYQNQKHPVLTVHDWEAWQY